MEQSEVEKSGIAPIIVHGTSQLVKALASAQSKIKTPKKNQTVSFSNRTYSYADLASVLDAIREPLTENGLAYYHKMGYCEGVYGMRTVLAHVSGEFIDTWYPLPDPQKQSIKSQDFGSALTYARRYSISSLVGIASEDDDDGQAAAPTPRPQATAQQRRPQQPSPSKPKPDPIPKDKQYAPPVKEKPADPAEYVMPFGSEDVIGKKLIELNEATLRNILNWSGEEMIKTPPPKNVAQIVEVNAKVKAFFKTMGVSS